MTEISGQYGLVLLFDNRTNHQATNLNLAFAGGNEIRFDGTAIPHMTLYHAKFIGLTVEKVRGLLSWLEPNLPQRVRFRKLTSFGGKFIFWEADRSRKLNLLHDLSLELVDYLDRKGICQADTEKLELTPNQRENLEQFGHPLVHELWNPHITIGYFPRGLKKPDRSHYFIGEAVTVAFAKMGENGTVGEIVTRA